MARGAAPDETMRGRLRRLFALRCRRRRRADCRARQGARGAVEQIRKAVEELEHREERPASSTGVEQILRDGAAELDLRQAELSVRSAEPRRERQRSSRPRRASRSAGGRSARWSQRGGDRAPRGGAPPARARARAPCRRARRARAARRRRPRSGCRRRATPGARGRARRAHQRRRLPDTRPWRSGARGRRRRRARRRLLPVCPHGALAVPGRRPHVHVLEPLPRPRVAGEAAQPSHASSRASPKNSPMIAPRRARGRTAAWSSALRPAVPGRQRPQRRPAGSRRTARPPRPTRARAPRKAASLTSPMPSPAG